MATSIEVQYVRGEISAREYWMHKLPLPAFDEQCRGCLRCEERFRSALDAGFWKLHALDRSAPFWTHTNHLATETKLDAFAEYQIARGEDVVDSAWLLIAIRLRYARDHLESTPWRILLDAGSFDPALAVCTAWNMASYWDDHNIERLALLAATLREELSITKALQHFAERGANEASWTASVMNVIAAT